MKKEWNLNKNATVTDNEKSNECYEQVKSIIDDWPAWKKEIHQKLVRLTT